MFEKPALTERKKLTKIVVEKSAAPTSGRREIYDEYLPGFVLRITPNDIRSYVARGRIKGQPTPIRVTIGNARDISLADARQRAAEILQQMRRGIDPRPQRGAPEPVQLTFIELVDEWARLHLSRRSPRYAAEAAWTIRKNLPELLHRPVGAIARAEVVNALDKIILEKPGAARNALNFSRACLAWAEKRGKVDSNPFANLPVAIARGERERVLSNEELTDLWAAAGALGYPWGAFYQLLTLTLQRRETVATMQWSEIEGNVWRIPGSKMKMAKQHDVHLSAPALAVLDAIPRFVDCDYVLTATGLSHVSGYTRAKQTVDAAIARLREADGRPPMPPWVQHDLRRTGVSKIAELGFDAIVADLLLAHQPAKLTGAAKVYQRYTFAKERAAALDAWAAFVTGRDVGNVVSLSARAAQ